MPSPSLYHRHRFPAEIISHCVRLYFRFALSFRDVEEMLAMRGVSLSYETVREWCLKFGQTYANGLRHKSPGPGDQWHLDGLSQRVRRNVFSQPSESLPHTSEWEDICTELALTEQ